MTFILFPGGTMTAGIIGLDVFGDDLGDVPDPGLRGDGGSGSSSA